MKKALIKAYAFFRRHILGGRGLSKYKIVKEVNFRLERFLRGPAREYVDYKNRRFYQDPRGSLSQVFEKYEPETTEFVESNLRAGQTFIDVGASIGWFTLIASGLVGETGRVIAVEPNPLSAELLRKNIGYNHCGNVTIVPKAAGSHAGRSTLYVIAVIVTGGSLNDPRSRFDIRDHLMKSEDQTVHEYPVEVISLDSLAAAADMVKIDVEGGDYATVQGLQSILSRSQPVLIIEQPSADTEKFLSGLNYRKTFFFDELNA